MPKGHHISNWQWRCPIVPYSSLQLAVDGTALPPGQNLTFVYLSSYDVRGLQTSPDLSSTFLELWTPHLTLVCTSCLSLGHCASFRDPQTLLCTHVHNVTPHPLYYYYYYVIECSGPAWIHALWQTNHVYICYKLNTKRKIRAAGTANKGPLFTVPATLSKQKQYYVVMKSGEGIYIWVARITLEVKGVLLQNFRSNFRSVRRHFQNVQSHFWSYWQFFSWPELSVVRNHQSWIGIGRME